MWIFTIESFYLFCLECVHFTRKTPFDDQLDLTCEIFCLCDDAVCGKNVIVGICVCVCVCERERERETKIFQASDDDNIPQVLPVCTSCTLT